MASISRPLAKARTLARSSHCRCRRLLEHRHDFVAGTLSAYEALKEAQNRRGAELMQYRPPQRPIVQDRHRMLKRARR